MARHVRDPDRQVPERLQRVRGVVGEHLHGSVRTEPTLHLGVWIAIELLYHTSVLYVR